MMRVAEKVDEATAANVPAGQRDRRDDVRNRRWLIIAVVSLISCLIIFSRRPDALLNPQFLAEDGTYFYAQAYNLGALRALTLPVAGYLVTSARLGALMAILFPVAWGPAIFNVLGILIQAAPVVFLMTDRFDHLIPNWYARGAIAFLYLAAPNSFELDAAMTYSQWHLALLAFLVVIAAAPSTRGWKIFDGATLLVAGLSGPFCLLLAPIILLRWLRTRSRHLLHLFALDLLASLTQVGVLLANLSTGRAHGALGIDGVELARIIAGQFLLTATGGMRVYAAIYTHSWWTAGWLPILLAGAIVVFLGLTLRGAPQELQLLWLFGALVLFASLFSPVTTGAGTYWQRLAHPMWNLRYVFFLIVAWLTTLIWILSSRSKPVFRRVALALLTCTCLLAIPQDWQYPPFTDYHYQSYARQFEQLPPGARIDIPLNPSGPTIWIMTLIKH